MDTCHRKAMLYAFFLEIVKVVVSKIVHQDLDVPEDGKNMYLDFEDRFKSYNEYAAAVNNCEFLSGYQRKQLLPENGVINSEELDFTMYMNILALLKETKKRKPLINYMKKLRNKLCHISFISLKSGMSHQEFKNELNSMEFCFKNYGVDTELINICKEEILRRI